MAKRTVHSGINKEMFLARNWFDADKVERAPTRNGYGEGLVEAGKRDKNVVVLCADLTESTRSEDFKKAFPDRFVQMGVSEQSMASIAAGMAMAGKVPFISSYAAFSPGRNWEQIRTTIALNGLGVKVAGAHAGVSVGPDGATHQPIEDIATMRVMPRMQVVVPADAIEARKATVDAAKREGPFYVRFAREKSPVFTTKKTPFRFGRAETFRHGYDLTIIGCGPLLYEALLAAEELSKKERIEVRVLNMHTVKPLDAKAIVDAAQETGAVVTIEEANVLGGLGGAVAEVLTANAPVPLERVGCQDRFGESGDPRHVQEGMGLTAPYIKAACLRALARKRGERVPAKPQYAQLAIDARLALQKEIMDEALARTPRKWGGKKPDASLKSRQKPKKAK